MESVVEQKEYKVQRKRRNRKYWEIETIENVVEQMEQKVLKKRNNRKHSGNRRNRKYSDIEKQKVLKIFWKHQLQKQKK